MIDAFKAHLQNRLLNKINNKGCVKCHLLAMGFKKIRAVGVRNGAGRAMGKKNQSSGGLGTYPKRGGWGIGYE